MVMHSLIPACYSASSKFSVSIFHTLSLAAPPQTETSDCIDTLHTFVKISTAANVKC